MVSAESCSTGFRSRAIRRAADRGESNGFDVASVNSRKPKLMMPEHAQHARGERRRRACARRAPPPASSSRESSTTAAGCLRDCPRRPPRGTTSAAPNWSCCATYAHGEIVVHERPHQATEGTATITNCPATAGATAAIQRCAPMPGRRCRRRPAAPPAAAPGSLRTGRSRESWRPQLWLSKRTVVGFTGITPPCLSLMARPLPAACSSHRAWPAPHRRRTRRPCRACHGRPRPDSP